MIKSFNIKLGYSRRIKVRVIGVGTIKAGTTKVKK